MTQAVEQLREALASARRLLAAESRRVREQALVLDGIRALSIDDEPDVLLARMFELLSSALTFDEAYVLEPAGDQLRCVAAATPGAQGATWPSGETIISSREMSSRPRTRKAKWSPGPRR